MTMSGLPPLTGFGRKWLLLSAMMEKAWYGPVVMGVLATWGGLSAGTIMIAERTRKLYTGNGQTYILYILYYFVFLCCERILYLV